MIATGQKLRVFLTEYGYYILKNVGIVAVFLCYALVNNLTFS